MNLHGLTAIGTQMGGIEKPNQVYDHTHDKDAQKQEIEHSDPSVWDYYITTLLVFQCKRKQGPVNAGPCGCNTDQLFLSW